jgi:hypothetical protein
MIKLIKFMFATHRRRDVYPDGFGMRLRGQMFSRKQHLAASKNTSQFFFAELQVIVPGATLPHVRCCFLCRSAAMQPAEFD